jgi:hypothetical protein
MVMPDANEENHEKSSVRADCIPADIRTGYLLNKTENRYRFNKFAARTSGKNGPMYSYDDTPKSQKDGRSSHGPLPGRELMLVIMGLFLSSNGI